MIEGREMIGKNATNIFFFLWFVFLLPFVLK